MATKELLDDLDLRILAEIQDDGRRAYTAVAKELDVSEATVRARVARMQRRGVLKFVVNVDPHTLGLFYVVLGLRVQGPGLKRAIEIMGSIPEVSYALVTAGTYDIVAEVVCRDHVDLLRLLRDEIRSIPGLQDVDTMTVLQTVKDQWGYPNILNRPQAAIDEDRRR